ncbi:organic cation transporter protein-like [Cydia pomonella]|uniref:organic cation transporter protein-like n=1 Tax=Cydia pomonella TaxID=82600 RepID=UPI002ADD85E1|nr:organic cation transporter protein-like [Cydia pomonella]XP_061713838.1 organic cation transporter protein-like [Cydia pomonella]XP_061713839.1 organic cation transporter protein-like [Cydia pomonella]
MTAKDMKEKVEEPSEGFNLDGILCELGSFGKYQLLLLLLLSFRDSFLAMCNFNYVFAAAEVPYRCAVPECDSIDPSFNASWAEFALRNTTNTCYRAAPYAFNSSSQRWNASNSCSPDYFSSRDTMACERVVYENYNSVAAEFDLGCEPWKRTMIGTVHNIGLIISYILYGFVSDRYGRKVIIVGTPILVGIVGLVKSFSVNYWMLLALEFIETAFGYGNASMVLSLEAVSQNGRVAFSCIWDIFTNIGTAFFGLIAWKVPYWRHLLRAIYAPLLVVVFYIFLIDEGVRWLLAHNKNDEAVRVLNKVAKINNVELSNKAKQMMKSIEQTKSEENNNTPSCSTKHLLSVLRSRTILLRLTLISACFICLSFVYTSAIIYSTGIFGNKYLNYSALQLVAVPTRIITALTLNRFGRKAPICVAYCLAGVCFISSAFVPSSLSWLSVVLYLIGKMCNSYGMFSLYVVSIEIFPTTVRNSLANVANTVGRIGAILAPQVPLLEQYMHSLPSVVIGLVAFIPGLLALLLPETSRSPLPDDIQQAEKLDQTEEDVKV